MRFSPYAMKDYGLQHRGGAILPFTFDATRGDEYGTAAWNLYWAATPEIDRFLDLKYEDFEGFKALCGKHPYRNAGLVDTLLRNSPELVGVLATDTPVGFAAHFVRHAAEIHNAAGTGYRQDLTLRTPILSERLEMAQSLIDVSDAAAMCQAVVAVDFRARKRL